MMYRLAEWVKYLGIKPSQNDKKARFGEPLARTDKKGDLRVP